MSKFNIDNVLNVSIDVIHNSFLLIYTDGYKSETGTGCVFCAVLDFVTHSYKETLKLNKSIFQAEILTIREHFK